MRCRCLLSEPFLGKRKRKVPYAPVKRVKQEQKRSLVIAVMRSTRNDLQLSALITNNPIDKAVLLIYSP